MDEEKKHIIKSIFSFILITFSIILTIYKVFVSFKDGWVINLLSFAPVVPLGLALYQQVDFVFIYWNKLKAYFLDKTVHFIPKATFYVDEAESLTLSDLDKLLKELINEQSLTVIPGHQRNGDSLISYLVQSQEGIKFELGFYYFEGSQGKTVDFSCTYQASSRSVMEIWRQFIFFKDHISNTIKSNSLKYSIDLNTKESNTTPFYKMMWKNIQPFVTENITLNVKNKDISMVVTKNKIYVTSEKFKVIEDIIKNYVPMTEVH